MRKTVKFLTAIALSLLLVFGGSMALYAQDGFASILIYKDVIGDPENFETFTFRVESVDDPEVYYTGAIENYLLDGVSTPLLPYGDYTVTEISIPQNYRIVGSASQTFTITAGTVDTFEGVDYHIVTFTNEYIPPGSITVVKDIIGDTPPPNDTFSFSLEGPLDHEANTTRNFDIVGENSTTFNNLIPGDYRITELPPPTNYTIESGNDALITVEGLMTTTAIVTNSYTAPTPVPDEGSITVVKDIIGDTPSSIDTFAFQLEGPLEDEENMTRDFTISGEDSFTYDELKQGEYRLTELPPPSNYSIESGNDVLIIIGEVLNQTATVTNRYTTPTSTPDPEEGSITISKDIIGNTPPSNATFSFQLVGPLDDEENMTRDFNIIGEDSVTFNELKQGDYRITELPPPANYTIESGNDAVITIGEVLIQTATVTNRYTTPTSTPDPEEGSITITKDIIGNTPPSNATFSFQLVGPLDDEENMTRNFNIIGEDSVTFNELKQGDYRITELPPPTNYTIESGNDAVITIGEVMNASATVTNRYTTPTPVPVPDPTPTADPEPDPEPDVDRGTVRVHYVDTDDNPLDPIFEFTGPVGTNYGTAARTYEDLELVATPANAFGIFVDDITDVIYVYSDGEEVVLPEPEVPLAPPVVPEEEIVPDEMVPEEMVPEEEIVLDEEVPLADALPQTGQLPAELFFGFGSLISMMGVAIRIGKKNR